MDSRPLGAAGAAAAPGPGRPVPVVRANRPARRQPPRPSHGGSSRRCLLRRNTGLVPPTRPQLRYSHPQHGSEQNLPVPAAPRPPGLVPSPSPCLSNRVFAFPRPQLARRGLGCLAGFARGGSVRLPARTSPEGGESLGAETRGGIRAKGREPGSVRAARALPAVHFGQDLLHGGARKSLRFGGHRHRRHLEGSRAFARGCWWGGGHLLNRGRTRVLSSCDCGGWKPLPVEGLR